MRECTRSTIHIPLFQPHTNQQPYLLWKGVFVSESYCFLLLHITNKWQNQKHGFYFLDSDSPSATVRRNSLLVIASITTVSVLLSFNLTIISTAFAILPYGKIKWAIFDRFSSPQYKPYTSGFVRSKRKRYNKQVSVGFRFNCKKYTIFFLPNMGIWKNLITPAAADSKTPTRFVTQSLKCTSWHLFTNVCLVGFI